MHDSRLKNLVLVLASSAAEFAWADYAILDLGTLGGTYSAPVKVNINMDAVGDSRTSTNVQHAFFFSGSSGAITDLHSYLPYISNSRSFATAVNDSGQITGAFGVVSTGPDRAFLLDTYTGLFHDIGTLGGQYSISSDMNALGVVVGNSTLPGDTVWHAFIYSGGTITDLSVLSGRSDFTARVINNNGDVGGGSGGWSAGLVYSNGIMTDIGTLGGSGTSIQDLNDNGQVVGNSYLLGDSTYHAFVYENGVMTDLGSMGGTNSVARAINNSGDIVGGYYTAGPGLGVLHPFLYSNGVMQDLNSLLPPGSGWTLQLATDINEYGQIVGTGTIGGETHGFLLSPGC